MAVNNNKKREGWKWIETKNGGYHQKIGTEARHKHQLSFFCPNEKCKKITGTIDDKYLQEYGVCAECYVMYIENREKPAIDLSKYKKKEI